MLLETILVLTFLSVEANSNIKITEVKNDPATRNSSSADVDSKTLYSQIKQESTTTDLSITEFTTDSINTSSDLCETNDTKCSYTNTNTISPIKNGTEMKKSTVEKHDRSLISKLRKNTHICTCNLQLHYCDINCCCDPDCSTADKLVFGFCQEDDNHFYDARFCSYTKYIYVNNTPFEWEVNQDGLFCVISSNQPESYVLQREEPFESLEAIQLEKPFWSRGNSELFNRAASVGSKNYDFDDSVLLVRGNSSVGTFRLPSSFIISSCIFKEDIHYLKDIKNTCSQPVIDNDNDNLSFESYFKNFKIIRSPLLLNLTKLKRNVYKNCPKNICLDIQPKKCDMHFTNCFDIKSNNSQIKFQCSYDIKKNLNICFNLVESIHYMIYHNGTNGIIKVEVLGVLKNLSYHFGDKNIEFVQDFSVEFLWVDQIKNYSEIFSGNPGYITGKPILMGLKRSNGNYSSIERNSTSYLDNYLVFPANVDGVCLKNHTFNTPVEFGYNMITQCELKSKFVVRNLKNATEICKMLQENIFDLWGTARGHNTSLAFGHFGNSNSSNLQDWSSVFYRTEPLKIRNETRGLTLNENKTLLCQNIHTLLNVDVFYSRVDLKSILNQQKILAMVYDFENKGNYSFSLNNRTSNISIMDLSFRVMSRVSFYDVTGEKIKRFVDPPGVDIRLPYDFFYPFVRLGNNVTCFMPNIFVITVFLYVSFLV